MSTNTAKSSRPRTWTVLGRDPQDRVVQLGPYTDKEVARTHAQRQADRFGTAQRVSTRGHFGSFTVEPQVR